MECEEWEFLADELPELSRMVEREDEAGEGAADRIDPEAVGRISIDGLVFVLPVSRLVFSVNVPKPRLTPEVSSTSLPSLAGNRAEVAMNNCLSPASGTGMVTNGPTTLKTARRTVIPADLESLPSCVRTRPGKVWTKDTSGASRARDSRARVIMVEECPRAGSMVR